MGLVTEHSTVPLTPFEVFHMPALPLSDFHGQLSLEDELQHLFAARDGLVG